jgi:hypothetical protein
MVKKTIEEQIQELDEQRNNLIEQLEKEKSKGMQYVIARTYSAGVFAGYLFRRNGKEAVLKQARRIWYWEGAASLSELAVRGTSKPDKCKFPVAVSEVTLTEVIEIIPTTKEGQSSIEGVSVWSL